MAARSATPAPNLVSKAKPAAKKAARAKAKLQLASRSKPSGGADAKSGAIAKSAARTVKRGAPDANAKTISRKPAKQPAVQARAAAMPMPKSIAVTPRAKGRATSSLARDALKAHAMKKTIAEVITPVASGTAVVDAYLREVDHPFKAEMEAVRAIILSASPKIAERIKWNAPSFYYKGDLGAFNPRANEYAHLILLFPGGSGIPTKGNLLEGKLKDRREAKFHSLADVAAKKPALENLVRSWVKLRDL